MYSKYQSKYLNSRNKAEANNKIRSMVVVFYGI